MIVTRSSKHKTSVYLLYDYSIMECRWYCIDVLLPVCLAIKKSNKWWRYLLEARPVKMEDNPRWLFSWSQEKSEKVHNCHGIFSIWMPEIPRDFRKVRQNVTHETIQKNMNSSSNILFVIGVSPLKTSKGPFIVGFFQRKTMMKIIGVIYNHDHLGLWLKESSWIIQIIQIYIIYIHIYLYVYIHRYRYRYRYR